MFEFLDDLPVNRMISAVYFAMRCLTHRVPYLGDATPEEKEAMSRVLREIEEAEGGAWEAGDEIANKYVPILSRAFWARLDREHGFDPKRGRELLQRLRDSVSLAGGVKKTAAADSRRAP